MPACKVGSSAASMVSSEIIGCVPTKNLCAPSAGSYSRLKSNGFFCPHHPQMGEESLFCIFLLTYKNPCEPGPPLRYLYVQPIAKSTLHSSNSTRTEPAE